MTPGISNTTASSIQSAGQGSANQDIINEREEARKDQMNTAAMQIKANESNLKMKLQADKEGQALAITAGENRDALQAENRAIESQWVREQQDKNNAQVQANLDLDRQMQLLRDKQIQLARRNAEDRLTDINANMPKVQSQSGRPAHITFNTDLSSINPLQSTIGTGEQSYTPEQGAQMREWDRANTIETSRITAQAMMTNLAMGKEEADIPVAVAKFRAELIKRIVNNQRRAEGLNAEHTLTNMELLGGPALWRDLLTQGRHEPEGIFTGGGGVGGMTPGQKPQNLPYWKELLDANGQFFPDPELLTNAINVDKQKAYDTAQSYAANKYNMTEREFQNAYKEYISNPENEILAYKMGSFGGGMTEKQFNRHLANEVASLAGKEVNSNALLASRGKMGNAVMNPNIHGDSVNGWIYGEPGISGWDVRDVQSATSRYINAAANDLENKFPGASKAITQIMPHLQNVDMENPEEVAKVRGLVTDFLGENQYKDYAMVTGFLSNLEEIEKWSGQQDEDAIKRTGKSLAEQAGADPSEVAQLTEAKSALLRNLAGLKTKWLSVMGANAGGDQDTDALNESLRVASKGAYTGRQVVNENGIMINELKPDWLADLKKARIEDRPDGVSKEMAELEWKVEVQVLQEFIEDVNVQRDEYSTAVGSHAGSIANFNALIDDQFKKRNEFIELGRKQQVDSNRAILKKQRDEEDAINAEMELLLSGGQSAPAPEAPLEQ